MARAGFTNRTCLLCRIALGKNGEPLAKEPAKGAGKLANGIIAFSHLRELLRGGVCGRTAKEEPGKAREKWGGRVHPLLTRASAHFASAAIPKSLKSVPFRTDPVYHCCLSNGLLEIDNNLVENAIRPTAVGKKNWLFIGEAEAGHRSALIYTIVLSCRQHQIDPFEYLRDVLGRLPSATTSDIPHLTPAAWAKERTARARFQAAA